jgi:hypothetical protein
MLAISRLLVPPAVPTIPQKLWQLKNDPTHEQLVIPIDCGYQLGGASNRGYGSYPGSEKP